MPTHKSACKRLRQNKKRRLRNRKHRSVLRTALKNYRGIEDGGRAKDEFPAVASTIDKSAKRGIIHHRTAARLKSRLSKKTA